MKEAIKESKWYWYIPIISLIFLWEMSKWSFGKEKAFYRPILIMILACYHGFLLLCIVLLLFPVS